MFKYKFIIVEYKIDNITTMYDYIKIPDDLDLDDKTKYKSWGIKNHTLYALPVNKSITNIIIQSEKWFDRKYFRNSEHVSTFIGSLDECKHYFPEDIYNKYKEEEYFINNRPPIQLRPSKRGEYMNTEQDDELTLKLKNIIEENCKK